MSDSAIIQCVLNGDDGAIVHLLVVLCGPGLKYLVQSKYQSLNLQFEEAVSELFLHLRQNDWKALRVFQGQNQSGRSCKLSHYIYCIASRLLWRKMGRAVKEIQWSLPLEDMEDQVASAPDPFRRWEAADVMETIMAMPDAEDRTVLLLYKIEERSVEEVASLLKTTPGNVYTRCSRALKNLREQLAEGGAHV